MNVLRQHVREARVSRGRYRIGLATAIALSDVLFAAPLAHSHSAAAITCGAVKAPGGWANGPAIAAYEEWLERPMDFLIDWPDYRHWGPMSSGISEFLAPYQPWKDQLVIGLPLIPQEDRSASLQAGANGAYDRYWTALRQRLVEHGYTNNQIRLSWEFNGGWYNTRAAASPEAFKTYWRRVVRILREDPRLNLKFVWNATVEPQELVPVTMAYPGDDVVDIIGLDVYDESSGPGTPFEQYWDNLLNGKEGLTWYVHFARSRNKPLAIPEWGVQNWDNPKFIERMHEFIVQNDIYYAAYFESEGWNLTGKTNYPKAAKRYQELFRGNGRSHCARMG